MPRSILAGAISLWSLGCSAETETLTPSELCASSASPTRELEVRVDVHELPLGLVGHAAVACTDGSCCNPALYAPSIVCDDGRIIGIGWDPSSTTGADAGRPSLMCEGTLTDAPLATGDAHVGDPPPSECPEPTCNAPAGEIVLVGVLEDGAFQVHEVRSP